MISKLLKAISLISAIMIVVGSFQLSCWAGELRGDFPPDLQSSSPLPIDSTIEEAIILGLKEHLRDPDSARLSKLKASKHDSGSLIACGFVNAKNAFGGYAGKQPFIGIIANGKFELYQIGDDKLYSLMVTSNCDLANAAID